MLVAGSLTRLAHHGFAMRSMLRTHSGLGVAILAAGLLLMLTAAVGISVIDDAAGRPTLGLLGAPVSAASWIGELALRRPIEAMSTAGALLAAMLAILALIAFRRFPERGAHVPTLLLAAALAVAAQMLIFRGWTNPGGVLYLVAAIAAAIAVRRSANGGLADHPPPSAAWSRAEAAWLLAVAAVATLFRFFALNRVLDYFEGELAPYMIGATNLRGIVLANSGVHGPWAPLGFLYYLPIYLMVSIAGSTVLAVRMASALVAVITVVAGYLLAREIAGRRAGLVAAAILALDPLQIGWGRSDVHPHGATAWPALLLAWATLRMIATRRTAWCVAVAGLMGLCWHQYPSGQMAVLVPLMALPLLVIGDRSALRELGWRLGLIPIGLLLWFAGYPLASGLGFGRPHGFDHYLASLGSRVAGAEPGVSALPPADLQHLAGNVADLIAGIFIEIPHIFHQTFIPGIIDLPSRSLPWLVAAFAVVGLAMLVARLPSPGSVVVLALVVSSTLPAVFADVSYIKRAAVLYPVLELAAAIAIAAVLRAVATSFHSRGRRIATTIATAGFIGWACVCAQLWFSERQYPWGTPRELAIADEITRRLEPRTLVLGVFWDFYMEGKLGYLLHDELGRPELQPVVWFVTNHGDPNWRTFARRPTEIFSVLDARPWFSLWSGQDRRLPELMREAHWRRVVYLIQEKEGTGAQIELIRSVCPGIEIDKLELATEQRYHLRLAVCDNHIALPRP
jgi:4-amino-4-deoxy-L-arabinose transferase-like glycosyltransferase